MSKILSVGQCAIDYIVIANSPIREAQSVLINDSVKVCPGGMASNFAQAICKMKWENIQVELLTKHDDRYKSLLGETDLVIHNMNNGTRVKIPNCVSIVSGHELREKERSFFYYPGENALLASNELISFLDKRRTDYSMIHFTIGNEDINNALEIPLNRDVVAFLARLKAEGHDTLFSVDFAPTFNLRNPTWRKRTKEFLKLMDIILPSDTEAKSLLNINEQENTPLKDLSDKLFEEYNNAVVCIKGAEQGNFIKTEEYAFKVDPIENVNIIDPTGAGDIWCAGFISYLLNWIETNRPSLNEEQCRVSIRDCLKDTIKENEGILINAARFAHGASCLSLEGIGGARNIRDYRFIMNTAKIDR